MSEAPEVIEVARPADTGRAVVARARQAPTWRQALLAGLALAILVRVVLGLVAAYVALAGDAPSPCHFELARNGWSTIPPLEDDGLDLWILGAWQRWDACWYGKIATYGYEPGTNATAFFPLFPLLIRVMAPVLGGSVALAGYLISAAASVVALAALIRLVGGDLGPATGRRTALYVAIFPAAFFLVAPFSEATFLAFAALTFVGARERRWLLAGVAGLAGGLARPQGVLLVLPVAWEAIRAYRAARLRGDGPTPTLPNVAPSVAAAVAPLVGFGLFVYWTYATGASSPVEAQDAWGGRDFHWPWEVAGAAIAWGIDHGDPLQFLNLGLVVASAVVLLLAARRLPVSYTLWALPQLTLLAIRLQPTPLTSTSRYLLVIFPVFAALGLWGRNRWVDRAIVVGFAVGLGLLAQQFVRGDWVG